MVLLSRLAAFRQQRRTRKELWGNLGTEEGVDALLQTTWKFRGDKMEVYKKSRWGYRDDESILLGGFQQTEFPGAEVTVTQQESDESTPTSFQ